MKAIAVVLMLFVVGSAWAAEEKGKTFDQLKAEGSPPACKVSKEGDVERRGCCSHHGGVCGCAGGGARCCDGSMSPTCGC